MSRGKLLSTIHMRIHGFTDTTSAMKDEGEIYGIKSKEAVKLARFLEEIIEYSDEEQREESRASEFARKEEKLQQAVHKITMEKARELADGGSKFVWVGVEPLGYVSTILNIDKDKVMKANTSQITESAAQELEKFRGCIFVGYGGTMSERISSYLKRNHGIDSYVLEGGITRVAHEYFTRIS